MIIIVSNCLQSPPLTTYPAQIKNTTDLNDLLALGGNLRRKEILIEKRE